MNIVESLRSLIGTTAVLDAADTATRSAGVWRPDNLQAAALARPANTDEVAQVLRWCHENHVSAVTQGGLTGLVHGSDAAPRLWELRQYNDGPERVPHTVERFASGEKELFTKHGMQTVKFWTANDNSAFIYLLAHKDKAAADASWKGFFGDFREFMQAYRASHPDLPGGRGNGNEVRYLIPTDYSPRK